MAGNIPDREGGEGACRDREGERSITPFQPDRAYAGASRTTPGRSKSGENVLARTSQVCGNQGKRNRLKNMSSETSEHTK